MMNFPDVWDQVNGVKEILKYPGDKLALSRTSKRGFPIISYFNAHSKIKMTAIRYPNRDVTIISKPRLHK